MKVPHLFWYLPWNLVCPHGVLIRLLPKTKVESSKSEGEGDTNPEADQDEHSGERNSPRAVNTPDEKV